VFDAPRATPLLIGGKVVSVHSVSDLIVWVHSVSNLIVLFYPKYRVYFIFLSFSFYFVCLVRYFPTMWILCDLGARRENYALNC